MDLKVTRRETAVAPEVASQVEEIVRYLAKLPTLNTSSQHSHHNYSSWLKKVGASAPFVRNIDVTGQGTNLTYVVADYAITERTGPSPFFLGQILRRHSEMGFALKENSST